MTDEMYIVDDYMRGPFPVNVKSLILELGVNYREEPMMEGDSGRIDYDESAEEYTIYINTYESPQRKRFTAAHELGHYLLHRDLIDERGHLDRLFDHESYRNPDTPLTHGHEVQANQFAANLLMPAVAIKEKYDATRDNVGELAHTFAVSAKALKIRLKTLGLRETAA